jgi:uncharacterized membrane protein (UPF0127 family)
MCIVLERAEDQAAWEKGLSGRAGLKPDKGMVFVFPIESKQCFWMKDMRFPLDMVWLDDSKAILKIESNVTPDTYPDSFCSPNTRYVLEFNAGFAREYGLKLGQTLQF